MKRFLKQYGGLMLVGVFITALAGLGLTYYKEIWAILTQQSARDAFQAFVRDSGLTGVLAFLGLQVAQVVVAVLPGEPVELMAGALYGTWGGLAMCMIGLWVGSVIVYYAVKATGPARIDPATLHKYKFLCDDAHVHFFLFLLYFIPGTPKDILLYIGPFLPVRARTFFLIAMFARIPSVITSTYAGATLMEGRWQVSILVFAVTGVLALLCIWQQENLLRLLRGAQKQARKHVPGRDSDENTK